MEENEEPQLRHWERRLLLGLAAMVTAVMGTWAAVVYNGTQNVVYEMKAVREELASDRISEARYQTLMERRITILEQRQAFVISTLRRMNKDVGELDEDQHQ